MKKLSDNTEVSSKLFYYLLDWKDLDETEFIQNTFSKSRIRDLTSEEFEKTLKYAFFQDMKLNFPNESQRGGMAKNMLI